MRSRTQAKSLWDESMKIGFPELDEERKNAVELLELLEVRPMYSIASETFISRFSVVRAAVAKYLDYEESLLHDYPLPAETRHAHIADHQRIRTILERIRTDSLKRKNQTALDAYKALRSEIERHLATFGSDVSSYARPLEPMAKPRQAAPATR